MARFYAGNRLLYGSTLSFLRFFCRHDGFVARILPFGSRMGFVGKGVRAAIRHYLGRLAAAHERYHFRILQKKDVAGGVPVYRMVGAYAVRILCVRNDFARQGAHVRLYVSHRI